MIVFTPIYILTFLSDYTEIDTSLSKFIEKYEEIIKIDKKKNHRLTNFPDGIFILMDIKLFKSYVFGNKH